MTDAREPATTASLLACALEALTERAFKRCLFPKEVKQALVVLDAYEKEKANA